MQENTTYQSNPHNHSEVNFNTLELNQQMVRGPLFTCLHYRIPLFSQETMNTQHDINSLLCRWDEAISVRLNINCCYSLISLAFKGNILIFSHTPVDHLMYPNSEIYRLQNTVAKGPSYEVLLSLRCSHKIYQKLTEYTEPKVKLCER